MLSQLKEGGERWERRDRAFEQSWRSSSLASLPFAKAVVRTLTRFYPLRVLASQGQGKGWISAVTKLAATIGSPFINSNAAS
jgi:hypothetical protein